MYWPSLYPPELPPPSPLPPHLPPPSPAAPRPPRWPPSPPPRPHLPFDLRPSCSVIATPILSWSPAGATFLITQTCFTRVGSTASTSGYANREYRISRTRVGSPLWDGDVTIYWEESEIPEGGYLGMSSHADDWLQDFWQVDDVLSWPSVYPPELPPSPPSAPLPPLLPPPPPSLPPPLPPQPPPPLQIGESCSSNSDCASQNCANVNWYCFAWCERKCNQA